MLSKCRIVVEALKKISALNSYYYTSCKYLKLEQNEKNKFKFFFFMLFFVAKKSRMFAYRYFLN